LDRRRTPLALQRYNELNGRATAAAITLYGFLALFALAVLAARERVIGLAVNTLVWLWTSWILPNRRVPWKALLPAAVVGTVGLEVLKVAGGYVVPKLVARSSALYGTIGVVFALLTWLLVLGRLVVFVTVVEVIGWERWHGTEGSLVSGPAFPTDDA
jgi:uncharacterized BrkB/YihY/UPF0761 family membrane protein